MEKLDKIVAKILQVSIVCCLAVMIIMVFTNVVLRYFFNSGVDASEELSRMVFVWLTFLGAILAMRDHNHLGIDTFVRKLSPAAQKAALVIVQLGMLYICYLFVVGGWKQTALNLTSWAPVTGIPFAVNYAAGLVAGLGIGAYIIANLVKVLTNKVADKDLVLVVGSADAESAEEIIAESSKTTKAPQR